MICPHSEGLLLDASPLPHSHSPHHHREDRAVIGLQETLVEGAVRSVVLGEGEMTLLLQGMAQAYGTGTHAGGQSLPTVLF